MNIIELLKKKLRWDSLAMGKLPWLCTIMLFVIFKNSVYAQSSVLDFVYFLFFSLVSSIYGYLINDLFDISIDSKHGKPNFFAKLGFSKGAFIVALVFFASVLSGAIFVERPYFLPLWAVWFFLATFYSARPIRLKERGAVGLMAAFLSQYPLPVLLVFSAFNDFGSAGMWVIVIGLAVSGAAQELGHQRSDLENDRKTKTATFAVRTGKDKIDLLYRVFIILDLLAVLLSMVVMAVSVRISILPWGVNIFILPIFIYLIFIAIILKHNAANKVKIIDPYYVSNRQDIFNITYTLFPNFFLPFYLSVILTVKALFMYPIILIFAFITYLNFPKANFFWPVLVIYNEASKLFGRISSRR